MRQLRHEDSDSSDRIWLLDSVDAKVLNILQNEHDVLNLMHKVISIEFITADTVSSCLKVIMHPQQHFHAVDLILRNEED